MKAFYERSWNAIHFDGSSNTQERLLLPASISYYTVIHCISRLITLSHYTNSDAAPAATTPAAAAEAPKQTEDASKAAPAGGDIESNWDEVSHTAN